MRFAWIKKILISLFIISSIQFHIPSPVKAQATITVNPNQTYQTMTGWEATAGADPRVLCYPNFPNYKNQVYDLLVDELGINRLRLEIRAGVENQQDYWTNYVNQGSPPDPDPNYTFWREHRYSTVNDNADPNNINWSGFQFSEMDWAIDNVILPIKQRVEANGEQLFINVNYVAFTAQIGSGLQYIHNQPAEYAEFVLATYTHLQQKGLVPDTWEVLLEPA